MKRHSWSTAITAAALALALAGCVGKPRCRDAEGRSFDGPFAPAATILANGSICGVSSSLENQSLDVYLWGAEPEMRRLMLETRVKMLRQGWQEYDPSNEYVRRPENKLYFQQGAQSLSFEFRRTSWRFFGPNQRAAIQVWVTSAPYRPRPQRWR